MLTNWFAFLLHKFLKVRRDGAETLLLLLCCLTQGDSGLETLQSGSESNEGRQGRWKFALGTPTPRDAVTWAESSCRSLCAQHSSMWCHSHAMEFLLHLLSTWEKFSLPPPCLGSVFLNFIRGLEAPQNVLHESERGDQDLKLLVFYSHIDSREICQAKDNIPVEQWSLWVWLSSAGAAGD